MATQSSTSKFLSEISQILGNQETVDLPNSQIDITPERRCKLTWNTKQDRKCPGHIMKWDDTDPSQIKVISSQYAKVIKPRGRVARRIITFRVPTNTACGMRELLQSNMYYLKADHELCQRLGICDVTTIKDTPKETVWILTRTPKDESRN